ncbi:MAG: bacteriohemerythrin [Lachnospiraceae bacterium]
MSKILSYPTLNITLLDDEHVELFSIMNQVKSLAKDENMLYKEEELEKIFTRLKDYTKKHFIDEATFMEEIKYPRLSQHLEAHKGFTDKLFSFELEKVGISLKNQDILIYELMEYLENWLCIHIEDCDLKIAQFLNGTLEEE